MSWHYLRELEGESLEDICSGGELLQPLKSKITHAEFYCNGKLMDFYLDSLSGTTFAHSMVSLGEGKSMSSQEDSLAKICQQQEKAKDLMASDQDSGGKWQGSFAKYDPDTHSLRTPQCLLFEDSTEFCAILPKWGLMLNGELWEQQTLVHLIKGTESGLSPTPPPPPRQLAHSRNQGLWSCSRGNGWKSYREDTTRCDHQVGSGTNAKSPSFGKPQDMEEKVSDSPSIRSSRQRKHEQCSSSKTHSDWQANIIEPIGLADFWATEPSVGRVADGIPARLDKLKCLGNAQVPLCAATAWRLLHDF